MFGHFHRDHRASYFFILCLSSPSHLAVCLPDRPTDCVALHIFSFLFSTFPLKSVSEHVFSHLPMMRWMDIHVLQACWDRGVKPVGTAEHKRSLRMQRWTAAWKMNAVPLRQPQLGGSEGAGLYRTKTTHGTDWTLCREGIRANIDDITLDHMPE